MVNHLERGLRIENSQIPSFLENLRNFLGEKEVALPIKTGEKFTEIPSKIHHPELGDVLVEIIAFPQDTGPHPEAYFRKKHPFFYLIYSQLDPDEQKKLTDYLKNNPIVMLRRTRPSKEFKEALDSHCEEFHGGITLVTVFLEALERIKKPNGERTNHFSHEEQESLKNLEKKSHQTIYFFSLNEVQEDKTSSIVDKLNKMSDPYEFPYNVLLTIAEIEKGQTLLSLIFALTGVFYGVSVEKILPEMNSFTSMIASHGLSEALTMLMGAADRLKRKTKKEKKEKENLEDNPLINFLGISGQVFHKLPPKVQETILQLVNNFDQITEGLIRALSLTASVSVILGGSYLANNLDNILPFLLIAPVNTSIILLSEIVSRWYKIKHSKDKLSPELVEEVVFTFGERWKKWAEKHPYLSLAIQDFSANQPALYSWLGSLASVPSILILKDLFPNIPDNILYGLSSMFFEGAGAGIGRLAATRKDPLEVFLRILEKNKQQ